jgi:hypothetical protein
LKLRISQEEAAMKVMHNTLKKKNFTEGLSPRSQWISTIIWTKEKWRPKQYKNGDYDPEFKTILLSHSKTTTDTFSSICQCVQCQSIKGKHHLFTFENHKGGTTKLSDLKGTYVYIDIWAT